jgi:hypothetical protein
MFCIITLTRSFKDCTYPYFLFYLLSLSIASYLLLLISSSLFLSSAYIGPSMERSTSHLSTASYMSIEVTQQNAIHRYAKSHMHSCICTVLTNIIVCSFDFLSCTTLFCLTTPYPIIAYCISHVLRTSS